MEINAVSAVLSTQNSRAAALETTPRDTFAVDPASIMRLIPARPLVPLGMEEPYKAVPPEGSTLFAEIKDAEGKTLAKIFNSGLAVVPGSFSGPDGGAPGLEGPALAQARAAKLAEALGGVATPASTAMSQADWDALPVVWRKPPPFLPVASLLALQAHGQSLRTDAGA